MSKMRFVGLDVHAETIAVAVAESGGEVRAHGVILNRLESIRKLILVPTKAGDRVKTDRRDAEKLAR